MNRSSWRRHFGLRVQRECGYGGGAVAFQDGGALRKRIRAGDCTSLVTVVWSISDLRRWSNAAMATSMLQLPTHLFASWDDFKQTNKQKSPLDGTVFAGAADGNLYALDGASGALRWTYSTTNGTGTSATGKLYGPALSVDGSTVYVTCNSGGVHAVGSADGQLRWSHATAADAIHGLQSSPTVHPTNGVSA